MQSGMQPSNATKQSATKKDQPKELGKTHGDLEVMT